MEERRVQRLMEGAIDLHIHSAPSHMERKSNDLEAAREAKAAGMRAILIKDHLTQTADRAQIASGVTQFSVWGGIALNLSVGGLNLLAVKAALPYGIKQVWMPTLDARQFLRNRKMIPGLNPYPEDAKEGICLLQPTGLLKEEVFPILRCIAENDLLLGTGHISAREAKVLVREAFELGVKKVLITHPQAPFLDWTLKEMQEVVEQGAYLEQDVVFSLPGARPRIPPQEIAKVIRSVGPERCVMATDAGQASNPPAVEMLRYFIAEMLREGIEGGEIEWMVKENPARLLGLP
ncbi:MAG: DUF6282 family protein [candidate division NC10 bacterium]|nr:DUF6282 family protein [candidate division NC10 bacterium]